MGCKRIESIHVHVKLSNKNEFIKVYYQLDIMNWIGSYNLVFQDNCCSKINLYCT
jgi:hypothetical protein